MQNIFFMLRVHLIFLLSVITTSIAYGSTVTTSTSSSSSSEGYEFGDSLGEDIRNIAYFLRQHKFNEYDRRYITSLEESKSLKHYFETFPRPPLRALHWEVHKFCEPSFLECVAYLTKRIRSTALRRNDDTSVVIEEQKWFTENYKKQIEQTDLECRKLWTAAEERADPFQGPLERFQWRVTASYFMCSYTMKTTPELKHLNETSCDNHANCLDPYFGAHNQDIRANDSMPFYCAMYSFCPDPCCPIYHLKNQEECSVSPKNPCSTVNEPGNQQCSFNISENTDFNDLILNRWNVSCKCPLSGYKWSSFYGLCVDIDECEKQPCKGVGEGCLNLPGSYKCVCKWGYVWNSEHKQCEVNPVAEFLMAKDISELTNDDDVPFFKSVFRKISKKFSRDSSANKMSLSHVIMIVVLNFYNFHY